MYFYTKIAAGFYWFTSSLYDVKTTVHENNTRLSHIEGELHEIQQNLRTYIEEEKQLRQSVHEELTELMRLRSLQERA